MVTKTIDAENIRPQLNNTGIKVAISNLIMLAVGVAICLTFKKTAAAPFAIGVLTGVFNLYMYMRILKKGMTKPIDGMATFIMSRYYVKFIVIITLLAVLIVKIKVSPLPLLAGFTATIMTTIIAMVFISRKEFE